MKWLGKILLYGILAVSIFLLWENVLRSPCSRIIEYSIGAFDERFGLSQEEFIAQIESAETPWEIAVGKELFQYVPDADFKVNLIWSEEQARLYQGNQLEDALDSRQDSLDSIQSRYDTAVNRYEGAVRSYETKLARYEQDVNYWNERGGAPEPEFNKLQQEAQSLDSQANEIKRLLTEVNKLADENNTKVNQYNEDVHQYNDLFIEGQEFDAGNTDGTEINVYSYDGLDELRTLLVHEFGHVLGIDHIDDQHSVMYYLLNDDNQKGELTDRDISALELSCRL